MLKRGRHGVENQQLEEEIGDVLAIIDILRRKGALDMGVVDRKREQVYEKYQDLEL